MSRFNQILVAVLVAQIGLFVLVRASGDGERMIGKAEAILRGFDAAKASKLSIYVGEKKDGATLEFVRRGSSWVVTTHADYPAKESKLKTVLGSLASMTSRGPTTTSKSHHKKFRVSESEFEKKLVIDQEGGTKHTIYIGSSTGTRGFYVRVGEEDPVHSVNGLSDVGTSFSDWVDATLLEVKNTEASQIRVENQAGIFDLARAAGTWKLTKAVGAVDVSKAKQTEIDGVVRASLKVTVEDIVGTDPKPEHGFDKPLARITVTKETPPVPSVGDAGVETTQSPQSSIPESWVIEVGAETGNSYFVRILSEKYIAKVAKSSVSALIELTNKKLF